MKVFLSLIIAVLSFLPRTAEGAQSAQMTLWCYSLRFQQGEDSFGSTLNLTTVSGAPNGELRPDATWYWTSTFVLDYIGLPIFGALYVDLPPYEDANRNGFDDFFEVSQDVSSITTGYYETAAGGGEVAVSWTRAAGAKDGTCWLHLVDAAYGDLGTFHHTFEVIEYTGSLVYTPASNAVFGAVNLTQSLSSTRQLQGPVEFAKVPAARFDQFDLQPGGWTNEDSLNLVFPLCYVDRDTVRRTNYWGEILFEDGDPNTGQADYRLWLLSIDDLNDADGDQIPDFSDDPAAVPPPRRPRLTLSVGASSLWLSISGDMNSTNHIQATTNLAPPIWQTILSVKLTNDPHTVSIPAPAQAKFWRVLAE